MLRSKSIYWGLSFSDLTFISAVWTSEINEIEKLGISLDWRYAAGSNPVIPT